MESVWPRCPKCGRRWKALHPACGTVVAPRHPHNVEEVPFPVLGGYAVDKLLGAGGFGAVYLARRASDGAKVAIKVSNPEPDPILRLELEGEALGQLGGVHAPALYAEGRLDDGRPALVMEFVQMPMLADRLGELENGMPLDELGRRGISLLSALEAIHAVGLVHRDLKPENVFSADQPPVTRIFDFGLVKPAREEPRLTTTQGLFMGTPEYMAPEQLDSSAPVDQRADIYAIGAVLYEMTTGRPPFWGNAAEVQQALAHRRVARPSRHVPGLPAALEDVVLRCLAKDPGRRFGSTRELRVAFEAAVASPDFAAAVAARAAAAAASAPAATDAPAPSTAAAGAKPADAKAGDAKAQAAAGARRPMAVVAVHGIAVEPLMKALAAAGGQLAEVGRNGGIGLFGEKTSENPVRRAIRFADALFSRKMCRAAAVDLASVAVRKKPDGGERYVSAAFAKLQKLVEGLGKDGLYFTPAAADLYPERRGEPASSDGSLVAALPPPREADALTVVRSSQSPLIGRAAELEKLVGAARAALTARSPGLATVIADGGLGKSHLGAGLVEELRASRPDAALFELRVREPIEGDSEGTLRALLGRCFAVPVDKPADDGAALLGSLGPTLWPAAALALGWLTPEAPALRALGAAPGVLRATVSRAVGESLRLRARERPLVLIVDDAHFGDDAILDAIEYATMPEAAAPLWVCVLARPALAQMKPSWGERAGAHARVDLGPLSPEASAELARRLLHPVQQIPATALETLVAGTQGSPFLLTELVRGLKRDGIVRLDQKTGLWFLASDELARLPDLAVTDWLAEREISAMPPELAAHARLSSLLGADFSEDQVDGIMSELERGSASPGGHGLDAELQMDPHIATRQLLAMGVFKRQRNGRAAFRHALLRSAVEKSASDRLRAEVHAAAFRYYRTVAGMDDAERLPRLAFHAASAGRSDEAAPVYLDLADRARRRHAYVDAEGLYSRALKHLGESDLARRVVALRGRGFMRYRLSRRDSVDDLMAAREGARALGDRQAEVEIVLEAATALDWMVEYRKSRDLVTEAEALLAAAGGGADFGAGAKLLQASLLVGQGRALWRFSEGKQAIEKLRAALAMAEGLGDEAYEDRVISGLLLGDLLPYHGEVAEAERVFEAVVSACESHGDQAHLMVAFLNRRQLWIGRRDLPRALEDSRRSIEIAREIGFVVASFMGEYNLGELLYQAGDAEAAWPHVRRAVELEQKRLSGIGRPVAGLLEARLLSYLGRDDEARRAFDAIVAAQAEAERTEQTEGVLLPSERVMLSLVDLCTRQATAAEWKELRARADGASVEQELIEVVEMNALAHIRRGELDAARGALSEALALAERIPNVMGERLRLDEAQLPRATSAAAARAV